MIRNIALSNRSECTRWLSYAAPHKSGSYRSNIVAWRGRIIIFTGFCGPTQFVVKVFLDSGAKAVACPSIEPDEARLFTCQGSGDFNSFNNGKFEIGEEEAEDDDSEPSRVQQVLGKIVNQRKVKDTQSSFEMNMMIRGSYPSSYASIMSLFIRVVQE